MTIEQMRALVKSMRIEGGESLAVRMADLLAEAYGAWVTPRALLCSDEEYAKP